MVDLALAGLAFSTGALSLFNPCSFAMLPAYISYYLGRSKEKGTKMSLRAGLEGAGFGVAATLGFFTIFAIVGVAVSSVGSGIKPYFPFLSAAVGVILIILGLVWLAGLPMPSLPSLKAPVKGTYFSFYLFGIAYAFAAIACVFPVFLMIVFEALSVGGFLSGLLIFLIYALGMGSMMIIVSVAVALSKDLLVKRFRAVVPYVERVSAVILMIAGAYLIYYWYVTFGV